MEIISLTSNNLQNVVEKSSRAIQKGAVLVVPTDTVYGLIANAKNEKAVKRVYEIKKRDSSKALPVFIKNMAKAKELAKISQKNQELLETLWPGKVTAVLPLKEGVKIFGTNPGTIAMRIPFHRFINSLLETLNLPLTGTSANLSGMPACTKIDEVILQLSKNNIKPELVINGGDLPESRPSKIIDLTETCPKVIRD